MRPLAELLSPDDAFALVRNWATSAATLAELLPASPQRAGGVLEALQVTTRSPLGAVAYHTGGILIDHGWLRILGSGSVRLPRALDTWNGVGGSHRCPRGLLVADDAVGGFFAWFDEPRAVHYLAPDTLRWENLELGYSAWLEWCFTSQLPRFYESLRWTGWEAEVEGLAPSAGLSILPFLWAKGPPIGERSRRAVPVEELWALALDLGRQLDGGGDQDDSR